MRNKLLESVKDCLKSLALRAGLVVKRTPLARFDDMEGMLFRLFSAGYRPRHIIDAGAHVGQWTRMAMRFWPQAAYYLIEPQEECWDLLTRLQREHPNARLFKTALTKPGVGRIRMVRDSNELNSGAQVPCGERVSANQNEFDCDAMTLDDLVRQTEIRQAAGGVFLKMDLEGHEPQALIGADSTLKKTDVVLCETFFKNDDDPSADSTFHQTYVFLTHRNFRLYDIAALRSDSSLKPMEYLKMGDVVFASRSSPFGNAIELGSDFHGYDAGIKIN